MTEKADFSERLKQGMKQMGYPLRPVVLEREFNTRYWGAPVTLQAVRRWLRGEAIPSQDKLVVLAEWLKIEPDVLRFGPDTRKRVQEHQSRWTDGMNHQELESIDAFLKLPQAQRKIVREVITAFSRAYPPEPTVPMNTHTFTPDMQAAPKFGISSVHASLSEEVTLG